jgi:geranylgeranyl reductase family protein
MTRDGLPVDVVVIGAGPAGSAAARILAAQGLRTVILEKALLPRYKTCGGGLLRRAFRLLPESASIPVDLECHHAEVSFITKSLHFRTHRKQPVIYMTMRSQLDLALARDAAKVGAELIEGCVVRGVKSRGSELLVQAGHTVYRSRFVIAADGVNSLVARQGNWKSFDRLIPAIEYEIAVSKTKFALLSQTARFDFGLVPRGYTWVFPKRDHLSVGALTLQRGGVDLHETVCRYLRFLGIEEVESMERHGYVIPLRPRRLPLARDGIFLTGDAAGLVDPVTAEGLTHAILSGQMAARSILESNLDPALASQNYQTEISKTLLQELKIATWLARVVYEHPRFCHWIFRRHGQALAELMTDIVTGQQSYSGAVQKLWKFGTILKLLRMRSHAGSELARTSP